MKNIAIKKTSTRRINTKSSVLQDLLAGNQRFIDGNLQAVDNGALVSQTTGGQFPKAVVLILYRF